jgi:hypothetical protein
VSPGITDFSSIVFSDESEILSGCQDADAAYDRLIRPWKSRLGLFYVERHGVLLDMRILWLTALSIVAREQALRRTHELLLQLEAPSDLARIALRRDALVPAYPPGAQQAPPY